MAQRFKQGRRPRLRETRVRVGWTVEAVRGPDALRIGYKVGKVGKSREVHGIVFWCSLSLASKNFFNFQTP